MPSLTQVIKIDVEDGKLRCERQAEYGYDTVLVELPAVISRRRRDQRAALPVAEGDHGRQEEAARDQVGAPTSASRPTASATTTRAPTAPTSRPRRPRRRARSSRTRTRTRRSRRSSPGWTRGSCWHERDPGLRAALRRRLQQELARRRLRGRSPRLRARHRVSRDRGRRRPASATISPPARQLRRGEGLPRRGPRGPRAAGRRRDGQGRSSDGGHELRAVRRRPARLRDRRRPGRAPRRRRLHGGHRASRVEDGKLVAERPILKDSQISDVHYRSKRRRDHRPPERVRGRRRPAARADGRGRRASTSRRTR